MSSNLSDLMRSQLAPRTQAAEPQKLASSAVSDDEEQPDIQRITLDLPRDLHVTLKQASLEQRRSMSAILREIIEAWRSTRL